MIENELTLKESKQFNLKIWLATLFVALFSGLLAFGSYLTKNYIQSKAITYIDESYAISFSDDEINDYSFENTFNYILDCQDNSLITSSNDIYFTIHYRDHLASDNDIEYVIDDINSDGQYFIYNVGNIEYAEYVTLNGRSFKFVFLDGSNNTLSWNDIVNYIEHEEGEQSYPSLSINTKQSLYAGLKNAIELDIQSNNITTQDILSSILSEIISLLTGGIIGLSGGIGSGVSTLVTDIFISNSALSVFGGIIVVFAGVSLAIGLCRWIMNFLTSLGAKK